MNQVLEIIKNETLTYNQQLLPIAGYAGNSIEVFSIDEETQKLLDAEIKSTMFEGNTPYRQRYVIPNYEKKKKKGCEFIFYWI